MSYALPIDHTTRLLFPSPDSACMFSRFVIVMDNVILSVISSLVPNINCSNLHVALSSDVLHMLIVLMHTVGTVHMEVMIAQSEESIETSEIQQLQMIC
jgi:hypothetical protein